MYKWAINMYGLPGGEDGVEEGDGAETPSLSVRHFHGFRKDGDGCIPIP